HTMPFNVQRAWDELDGIDHPRIWTVERDHEVWDALTG
ncbi:MAG: MBL fold metallo-hydrolase, partial [Chloroflexota bacterium]